MVCGQLHTLVTSLSPPKHNFNPKLRGIYDGLSAIKQVSFKSMLIFLLQYHSTSMSCTTHSFFHPFITNDTQTWQLRASLKNIIPLLPDAFPYLHGQELMVPSEQRPHNPPEPVCMTWTWEISIPATRLLWCINRDITPQKNEIKVTISLCLSPIPGVYRREGKLVYLTSAVDGVPSSQGKVSTDAHIFNDDNCL